MFKLIRILQSQLCTEAFRLKKLPFILDLMKEGTTPPGDSVEMLFQEALRLKDFEGAKIVLLYFAEEKIAKLDLSTLLASNLVLNVELIEILINKGVRIKNSIGVVMNMKLPPKDQIDVIALLLDHGAECSELSWNYRGITTPLHVATELALESGKQKGVVQQNSQKQGP